VGLISEAPSGSSSAFAGWRLRPYPAYNRSAKGESRFPFPSPFSLLFFERNRVSMRTRLI
ncbi:hypothetical protein HMPREF3220_03851, partial [Citrobacter koseri]